MIRISQIAFFALLLIFAACNSTKEITDKPSVTTESPILLDFDKEDVTKAEFERVYQKNNGGYAQAKNHTTAQYKEYLDLYVNFKRKVFEAEDMGLDTTRAFKQEFETYRRQLAQPYLTAKEVEEKLVKEAYERSLYTVKASHLLLSLGENASPADTLEVYNRIISYRDSVVNGSRDFAYMASKYSEDPSARDNKGDLGYFSAFSMVYPFESAAYNTEVGSVSMPARTRYGYHIIQVNDKRKSGGTKRASHIIIRIGERYSAKDSSEAVAMVDEIYGKLEGGADFSELAKEYSDDPSTARRGGDLGTGRLLPVMEEIKIKLDQDEFSRPFTTRFGWHILKVTEASGTKSFEENKAELRRRIEGDSRAQISRQALINRIKKDYGYTLEEGNFNEFKGTLTPNFPRGAWTPETPAPEMYGKTLFTLSGDAAYKRTVQDLIDYYTRMRPRYPNLNSFQAAEQVLKNFVEKELVDYEESKLPEKNPEYRYLLKEYRDGILLFTLMEKKVWKKAVEDTTGLENFYNAYQDEFTANRTIDVREYRSTDEETINKVKQLLALNATDQEIDSLVSRQSALQLSIRSMSYEEGKGDADPELFGQEAGYVSSIIRTGDGFKILRIEESFPAGIQPLEKVKSEAITKYQDHLEQEWLKDLSYKYPVEINDEVFANLFK